MDYKNLPREIKFQLCKEMADKAEQEFFEFLITFYKNKFPRIFRSTGYNPNGDILDGKTYWFEVKQDTTSERTGNFFIEAKSLERTKAIYHCLMDTKMYYIFLTSELREMVNSGVYREVVGGDNKAFKGWLVPMKELARKARKSMPRKWKGDKEWYAKYIIKN